jgi:hypothetical protein
MLFAEQVETKDQEPVSIRVRISMDGARDLKGCMVWCATACNVTPSVAMFFSSAMGGTIV